ncbi:hypothetical protein GCM10023237_00070 [Streptomyces coeruleoprunus]
MDLTGRHPRTGELLSTVKFMVQTLAAAGELQRDLQRELTYDGLRATTATCGSMLVAELHLECSADAFQPH